MNRILLARGSFPFRITTIHPCLALGDGSSSWTLDSSMSIRSVSSSSSNNNSHPSSHSGLVPPSSTTASRRRLQSLAALRRPPSAHDNHNTNPSQPSPLENNHHHHNPSPSVQTRRRRRRPLYISATRQHVGKTTTSLAVVSGLQKRVGKIGFMKPVGQKALQVHEQQQPQQDPNDDNDNHNKEKDEPNPISCDKDAVLMKHYFGLDHLRYQDMSPVLIPKGYTKRFVDGQIASSDQQSKVLKAYDRIAHDSHLVVCEGTGHTAVGSCVHASNAQVASWLGARMVLVANGGLGHALDELELNRAYCNQFGVELAGVIINKVRPDKYEQTKHYLTKALQDQWGGVPLLGVIPDRPFLGCPAMADLEKLLEGSQLVSGQAHRYRHYTVHGGDLNLVATSLQVFLRNIQTRTDSNRTLYVCHASRHEILLGFLMESQRFLQQQQEQSSTNTSPPWEAALIVTGCDDHPPCPQVLEMVVDHPQAPPVLLAPQSTAQVLQELHAYTPKLYYEDGHRVHTAILHYESYVDFDTLLEQTETTTTEDDDRSTTTTTTSSTTAVAASSASRSLSPPPLEQEQWVAAIPS